MHATVNRDFYTGKHVYRPEPLRSLRFEFAERRPNTINPRASVMVRDHNAINAGSHVVEQPLLWGALFQSSLIWAPSIIVRGWSMGMEVKLPPPRTVPFPVCHDSPPILVII
ncbi:hypothetical protein BMS3Bbin04_01667 [bacterium BMS3Bbin04]|nr:hypothetical protein BMS3Bbin04_01667 [bacterium BMS3Bbin04]